MIINARARLRANFMSRFSTALTLVGQIGLRALRLANASITGQHKLALDYQKKLPHVQEAYAKLLEATNRLQALVVLIKLKRVFPSGAETLLLNQALNSINVRRGPMRLQAKSRLIATTNTSQRGYVLAVGEMLSGKRTVGKDCRAVATRYIFQHQAEDNLLVMVADHGDKNPIHCFVADRHGNKKEDAYPSGHYSGPHYDWTTSARQRIHGDVVAKVSTLELLKAIQENRLEAFAEPYPN